MRNDYDDHQKGYSDDSDGGIESRDQKLKNT